MSKASPAEGKSPDEHELDYTAANASSDLLVAAAPREPRKSKSLKTSIFGTQISQLDDLVKEEFFLQVEKVKKQRRASQNSNSIRNSV